MFRRRKRSAPSVEQQAARKLAARSIGAELAVEELPICQGLAQLHADVISSLELYATQNGRRVQHTPSLLEQPDPREDRATTLHKLVQSLWWEGNGYATVGHAGASSTLRIANPQRVAYVPDPFDDLWIESWYFNGEPVPLRDVAHWKINDDPRHGPLGRSPMSRCDKALQNYGWAYRYLADFFGNGGNPGMVLRSKIPLSDDDARAAQDQWIEARQAFRPAVLDSTQWTLEPGPEAQDLEQTVKVLEFAAVEVCRATNVSPSIANVLSSGSLTYSTTADELHRWAVLSLGPTWLKRIAAGFTRLLPAGLVAEFDTDTFIDPSMLTSAADVAQARVAAEQRPALRAVS